MTRFLAALGRLWRETNTPDQFRSDPYGGLLNQWGHYSLGVAGYVMFCAAFYAIQGEMPYRAMAAFSVLTFYVVVIEAVVQGWRGRDSFEDSLFVAMGVSTIALSLQVVEEFGWKTVVLIDVGYLAVSILCALAACVLYGIRRA